MTPLYCLSQYKNRVINLLIQNEDFVKLLNPSPSDCEYLDTIDILTGGEWIFDGKKYKEQGYVFDHNFVDDAVTEEKTFLFVEATVESIKQNILMDFTLYIYVFTAKGLVRLTSATSPSINEVKEMGCFTGSTYANRIDALSEIIDSVLNGCDKLPALGEVSPASRNFATPYTPKSEYYGKCLRYTVTNFNMAGDTCGD